MNTGKDILYIGGFELPDKNAAAQRVVANGKLLAKLGYEVSYIGLDRELKSKNTLNKILRVHNFKYWSLKYPNNYIDWVKYLISLSTIKNIITNKLSNKPLAIIAYNYPAIALLKLKLYCTKNNIKLIADCTEWYEPTGSLGYRIIKYLDTNLRMKYVHYKLDGIIVISKFLKNYYKKKKQNVVLLPPLVDKNDIKWKTTNYKPGSIRKLIYAGSPGDGNKDKLDLIIKALAKVKEKKTNKFQLNVIGITKEQYNSSFGDNKLPDILKNSIIFKGRISHTETIKEIQNSDFFIFIREKNLVTTAGFPTKFVEAISCGTPVLTNDSSNIIDYLVEDENGYLLNIGKLNSLRDTLENAISQSSEKIALMKDKCKSSIFFDYNTYLNDFRIFLNTIFNSNI